MSATRETHLRRTLLLAGVSALALAVGACSGAFQEKAEAEAKNDLGGAAALVRIGDASRAGGDLQTAVGFYERASTVAPNDAATQLRLATALLEMGSYSEAEVAYRRVLAADPANVEAMRGLGNIYIATDQPKNAVEQFQGAIAKKPSYQAYNGLGVAFDLEGKHAAAQKAYHEGLAVNATSLSLQNNLALSLALSGDYPAAIDLLRRVSQNRRRRCATARTLRWSTASPATTRTRPRWPRSISTPRRSRATSPTTPGCAPSPSCRRPT